MEFDVERDHVHLLINYPQKVSVSKLVNSLKGVSSRQVRKQKFTSVKEKLWDDSLWSQVILLEAVVEHLLKLLSSILSNKKQ